MNRQGYGTVITVDGRTYEALLDVTDAWVHLTRVSIRHAAGKTPTGDKALPPARIHEIRWDREMSR